MGSARCLGMEGHGDDPKKFWGLRNFGRSEPSKFGSPEEPLQPLERPLHANHGGNVPPTARHFARAAAALAFSFLRRE